MTTFVSAADAARDASYEDRRRIQDETADMAVRLRREMDAGLSPEDMKRAQAEKAAVDAAADILEKLFT